MKKSKLSVPVRYAVQQASHPAAASSSSDYSLEHLGPMMLVASRMGSTTNLNSVEKEIKSLP